MEFGTIRKLRYVLLSLICFFLTLTAIYFNPDLVPHPIHQMVQTNAGYDALPSPPLMPHHADTRNSPGSPISSPGQNNSASSTATKTGIPPQRQLTVVNYDSYPMLNEIECVLLKTAAHGAKICLHPTQKDIHVSGSLKRGGTWEPHIVGPVKTQLERCPDCQFIDIGANIGVFGLSVASMGRKVIAVEPLNANLLRLTKSIRLNGMQQTITTVANAVSDVYENVSFWQPRDNAGGTHSASINVTNFDKRVFDKAKDVVSTIKLDDLLQVITFEKAVMKIDIEGYEPRAFKCAAKLFDAVDIHYVFMEWSGKANSDKNYVQPMLDFFTTRDFQPHNVQLHPLNSAKQSIKFEATKGWPHDIIWVRP